MHGVPSGRLAAAGVMVLPGVRQDKRGRHVNLARLFRGGATFPAKRELLRCAVVLLRKQH